MAMVRTSIRNMISLLLLLVISVGYLLAVEGVIPDRVALVVNFMIFPVLLGFTAYFLLQGSIPIKLILLIVIPLSHVLFFGSEAAKPGLENLIAVGELFFMSLGVILGSRLRH